MRKVVWTMALLAIIAAPAAAQTPASQNPSQNPMSDAVRNSWNSVKRDIRESAELMPEENYDFKPTPEVRSFGEILAHVAGASFEFCGSARNEEAPYQEGSFEKTARTKESIVKATNDAIAYCDAAFGQLTDANMSNSVHAAFGGKNQVTRLSSLIGQISHDNEHYGNLVTYFRLKSLVPPSSRR